MGTIRRKREIYHVHPLPSELRDHETHNPEGHTHIIHRVREKKEGEAGHSANDETIRKRRKRQVDLPPVSSINFCPEDGKIKPPMSEPQELEEAMFVDMADTLVLNEFQSRTASIREFGNNYVHAAMFLDHTMYEKYNGDEGFLVLYHLTMFNIVSTSTALKYYDSYWSFTAASSQLVYVFLLDCCLLQSDYQYLPTVRYRLNIICSGF